MKSEKFNIYVNDKRTTVTLSPLDVSIVNNYYKGIYPNEYESTPFTKRLQTVINRYSFITGSYKDFDKNEMIHSFYQADQIKFNISKGLNVASARRF